MSEEIFLQLFERGLTLDESFPVDFNARWIKPLSSDDANLMAKADVSSIKLSLINAAALIRHKEATYFGVSGFDEPTELPPGLSRIEITPGLFSCFATALKLDSSATAAKIRDTVEGFSGAQEDYQGHDLNDILQLFPNILFYNVDNTYIYSKSIERILGSYLSRGYGGAPLRLKPHSRTNFANFFEEGPDLAPYALPLRGLLSFSWSGLYLELYRCIEQLYATPKVLRLTERWNSPLNIYEISKLLEDVLAWRPKEDEALELLFKELNPELCIAVQSAFRTQKFEDASRAPHAKAAKRIYALRNACVHFRPATKVGEVSDVQWNEITVFMLQAVRQLYDRFGVRFHSAKMAARLECDCRSTG